MASNKHLIASPWAKTIETHPNTFTINSYLRYFLLLLIFFSVWFLLLSCFSFSFTYTKHLPLRIASKINCPGNVSLYVYQLPPEFNLGLLRDCSHLNIHTNMCPHVANHGLGQLLSTSSSGSSKIKNFLDLPRTGANWFATNQFVAEMIFHARLENHPCRTMDPATANLFYVPFYGGLHMSSMSRESNLTVRDELAVRLIEYIKNHPWWQRHHGEDHFLVLGRTAWDFMRSDSGPDIGAGCLLNLPLVKNMSVLTLERQPWRGTNQYGIPYPSYFHPSSVVQMLMWQRKMRLSKRINLFSFIGGARKGIEKAAIRDQLIRQCDESTQCKLLKCRNDGTSKCHEPTEVLRVMSQSEFCLQAPGDSFTRRSSFDSVLAGCIPVFFSPHSAYTQYRWYLPADGNEYSVYIEGSEIEKRKIEEELLKISKEKVERMRRRIIELMPSLTYAHTNATDVGFEDAIDVAVAALAKLVRVKIGVAE